jgi:hypothetical protein
MKQLLLILLLSCSACSASGPAATSVRPGVGAAPLLAKMRAMVGTAACTDASQCKTVAIGARACGGPEAYLAYSTGATDAEALIALALRHTERRRAEVAKSGLLSTCNLISDPGATCRAGTCQLRSAVTDPS